MDILRKALSKALSYFVEPLRAGSLELSLFNGATLRNLTLKPGFINSHIEENDVELRLESGHIDEMTVAYSMIPSVVTIHIRSMRLRARPNVVAQLTKHLFKTLDQMMRETETESLANELSIGCTPGHSELPMLPTDWDERCHVAVTPPLSSAALPYVINDTPALPLDPHQVPLPPPVIRQAKFKPPQGPCRGIVLESPKDRQFVVAPFPSRHDPFPPFMATCYGPLPHHNNQSQHLVTAPASHVPQWPGGQQLRGSPLPNYSGSALPMEDNVLPSVEPLVEGRSSPRFGHHSTTSNLPRGVQLPPQNNPFAAHNKNFVNESNSITTTADHSRLTTPAVTDTNWSEHPRGQHSSNVLFNDPSPSLTGRQTVVHRPSNISGALHPSSTTVASSCASASYVPPVPALRPSSHAALRTVGPCDRRRPSDH